MKFTDFNNHILWVAAAFSAAAILSGCANSQDEPAESAPLIISAGVPATRAAAALDGKYDNFKYDSFGVWAWKTDADNNLSLVLGRKPSDEPGSEYFTRIEDNAWSYLYSDENATQYIRYWDPAASSYYFSAYAPYKLDENILNSYHDITASPDGVNIGDVDGNLPLADGIDWLEARWQRQTYPELIDIDLIDDSDNREHITANLTDVVPLVFHHILALAEFRIYAYENNILELTKIDISLGDPAYIYTLADYSAGAWTNASSTSTTLLSLSGSFDLSGATSKEKSLSLATLLQIPQHVEGLTLNVAASFSDGSERSGSFTLSEGWSPEKKYVYYLFIDSAEVILMSFSADDWESGGYISVDDVVNW